MSRAVNAVVIGVAVFILLAGSFWYLSVARGEEKLAVDSNLSVQSADAGRTRLLADLTFKNRHDVDVRLHSFAYEFRVNDHSLVKNESHETMALKAREDHHESIVLSFPTDFVSEWLRAHVQSGEKSVVSFAGNATFEVGSRNQTIEFEDVRDFSTDIRTSLEKAENCPRPSPQPCVEGSTATWRERDKTRVLDLSLRVKNGVSDEIEISSPKASLTWAGIEVANAEAGDLRIDGKDTETLEFALFLQHEKLKQWWPKHIQSCEKSAVALSVSFTFEVEPRQTKTSPTTTSRSTTSAATTSSSSAPISTSTTTSSSSTTPPASTSPTTASPTATNSSSEPTPRANDAPTGFLGGSSHQVTFLFLLDSESLAQQDEEGTRRGSWDLEGDDIQTRFVCDDSENVLDLP